MNVGPTDIKFLTYNFNTILYYYTCKSFITNIFVDNVVMQLSMESQWSQMPIKMVSFLCLVNSSNGVARDKIFESRGTEQQPLQKLSIFLITAAVILIQ